MKLPDLNVWLAAVWRNHADHAKALEWFEHQQQTMGFCRVTQMGLLRLLSNPVIMRDDVITRREAWDVYLQLHNDPRIQFLPEPPNLDTIWMQMSKLPDLSHKLWTDDYLAAFALSSHATLVTFDQALATRHPAVATESIG